MFAQISVGSTAISLCTEIQVDQDNVVLPLPLINTQAYRMSLIQRRNFDKLSIM